MFGRNKIKKLEQRLKDNERELRSLNKTIEYQVDRIEEEMKEKFDDYRVKFEELTDYVNVLELKIVALEHPYKFEVGEKVLLEDDTYIVYSRDRNIPTEMLFSDRRVVRGAFSKNLVVQNRYNLMSCDGTKASATEDKLTKTKAQ